MSQAPPVHPSHVWLVGFFFFGLESTQLACRVQPEQAQVEAQYWGNPKVAWLEGNPAILFWSRHSYNSHTQGFWFFCKGFCVSLYFIDPRVKKIRNEASSYPGIFSRTLRFYFVASSPGSVWLYFSMSSFSFSHFSFLRHRIICWPGPLPKG